MGKDYIRRMEIEDYPKRGEVYIVSLSRQQVQKWASKGLL
jgi:hypothetical protein